MFPLVSAQETGHIGQNVEIELLNVPCNTTKQCFDTVNSYGLRGDLARCNEDYNLCEIPKSIESGFKISWQMVVLAVASFALLGFFTYLEYQRPKAKKRFTNPLLVTMVAGTFMCAMIFAFQAIGILPDNFYQEHPWIFVLIFVGVYVAAMTWLNFIKPLSHKQLKAKAIEILWDDFSARPYSGMGFETAIIAFVYSDTKEENKMLNKVINFLIIGKATVVKFYLVSLSIIDGEVRRADSDPTKDEIKKLFSKEIVASADLERVLTMQSFTEDVQPQQPQNPMPTGVENA